MLPTRSGINVIYSSDSLPDLKSPYLICGFPGSGYVGKIAVDHLIEELHAERLADIYSTSFPPQVLIRSDGTADLMKNTIFYSKGSSGINLLLLTGDSQPANPDSEYLLAEEIMDIATKFNTNHVFTLAAYITGVFVEKPRIFGTATDTDTIRSFSESNISTMDGGSITGMNGLIIGIAKLRGIRGTCLLGETSGYVVDAKASKSILETLLQIVGINIDMKNLEKRAKDTEMLIQTIEQQMAGRVGQPQQQQGGTTRPSAMGYIS
ncbi:MAG: proteasome assembly chaperone family protein [Candidatus Nitrosopolaris sp.]|jgi:uncharacterized protein (TIGR00162 family)